MISEDRKNKIKNQTYDTNNGFTVSDWKLFRDRIVIWQENYMDRLNEAYIKVLTQDKNASDKFWEIEKRINKDKKRPGVILDMRRSTMIINICELLNDGVIKMDDLNDFSAQLKDIILTYRRLATEK